MVATGADRSEGDAADDATPDAEAAPPDLEGPVPVAAGVAPQLVTRLYSRAPISPPGTPQSAMVAMVPGAADLLPPALRQPDGGRDAAGDQQAIDVEAKGPDADAVGRRARQVGEQRRRSSPEPA